MRECKQQKEQYSHRTLSVRYNYTRSPSTSL